MKTEKDTAKDTMKLLKQMVKKSIADFKKLTKEEQERRITISERFAEKCASSIED